MIAKAQEGRRELWDIGRDIWVWSTSGRGLPSCSVVKNLPAKTRDAGDLGSTPGSGRSPGEGNGSPLQYSCLENPVNRGAWWATVHRISKSWTRLNNSAHTCMPLQDDKKEAV